MQGCQRHAAIKYSLGAQSTRGGIVRRLHRLVTASFCLSLALATAVVIRSQERASTSEWRYFGGNKAFTRYSPLDHITRDNVKTLRIVWRRPAVSDQLTQAFPDVRSNNYLRSTPIVIDGVLYAQNAHGLVVAFDGETGKTVWEQELFARTREEANGSSTRGVDYWGGGGRADKRIFAIRGEYLYALNAETGKPVAGFGDQGRASLHFEENQPLAARFNDSTGPLVVGNVVVVTGNTAGAGDTGTFKKEAAPEDVRGFDAQSGKLLWTFHVVPRPGEYGIDTWGNESWKIAGDLGAWNPMTADEDLGYVYIPLTAPTASAWGVWRPGDNLFADSLVALDAKTGKRVWHFQTVHHNLWEWANVGPAMPGHITVDHRPVRSRDVVLLRHLRIAARSVESRHQEDDQPGSDDGVRERWHVPRHRRSADHQGAVRSHHRDRSQHGHTDLDGRQRRRSSLPSVAEGPQPAAARRPEPSRAASDQDAVVPRRREQCRQRHAANGMGMGQEVPRIRQSDRPRHLRNRS